MSTKTRAIDYKFNVAPTGDRFNPLVIIEEWEEGEYVGDIRFTFDVIDMIIHHLEGLKKHPNLFEDINGA